MFNTRLARVNDASGIAHTQLASWAERGIDFAEIPHVDEVARLWEATIRDQQQDGRIIIVENASDSEIVGCAGVINHPETQRAELILLEVAPPNRRQQIASRLVNACADIARGFGAQSIHAWVGAEELAAITLLESSGWVKTGAQRQTMAPGFELQRDELELHVSLI